MPPNTFPSNNLGSAGGGESTPRVPVSMPFSATMVPLEVLTDIFDNDTDAKVARLGPQFRWAEHTTQLTTDWVSVVDLTGPGEVQFLAIWQVASLTPDADLRLVWDGNVLFTRAPAFAYGGLSHGTDGYIIVGQCLWDQVTNDPEYGGIQLENIPFLSSVKLQVRSSTGTNDNDFKAVYRSRTTT